MILPTISIMQPWPYAIFHLGKVDAKNSKVTFIPIEPEQNGGAKHDR